MSILLSLYLAFSSSAFALPLKIFDVGAFNGVRIMVPCSLASPDGHCFLDTAGGVSIFRDLPSGSRVMGKKDLGGIGWSADCQEASIPYLKLGDRELTGFDFMHCPTFTESFAPFIGMNALWGQRFDFDFAINELRWRTEPVSRDAIYLWAGGPNSKWIVMNATFHGKEFNLAWDTGAPITLVTHEFVAQFPGAFEEETARELPTNTKNSGGKAYRVKEPIVVGGVELRGEFVHAVDLKKVFGKGVDGLPVILGTNHLRQANWSFDLDYGQARVTAIEAPAPSLPER